MQRFVAGEKVLKFSLFTNVRLIVLKPWRQERELVYKNTASAKSDNNDKIGESSQTQIISKPKQDNENIPDSGDKVISKKTEAGMMMNIS